MLASVAPEHVRKLLKSVEWPGCNTGALAIETVKTQLENHETRKKRRAQGHVESKVPSLFDVAAEKLASFLEQAPEEELVSMESLPPNVLSRVAWKMDNIPYYMFCRAKHLAGEEGDTDEWVLRNEIWLREFSATSEREDVVTSKHLRSSGGETAAHKFQNADWRHGLVRLSLHGDVVFPNSLLTDNCRIITRPISLPGFNILDGRRSATVRIQPSIEMFAKTFETMTGGLLKGLEWSHIFVAGGIVLGALLCTDDKETTNTPDQWKSSDVDLYIHGLGPIEANKKIEHIFDVFKANLPKDTPVLVVRNSKTITFFSKYPLRRIQVVLKLVDTPKDVLLNFDLDICAVGWNGEEVYMLPRATRALETGYTVFTMDLINGHYLGDRRATQEQRVFKYADKGYGIRILPSYLEEHKKILNDEDRRTKLIHPDNPVKEDLAEMLQKERNWMAIAIRGFRKVKGGVRVPTVSHWWLQERHHKTEDPPRRSALSGFSLFMRHVALWEYEVAGLVHIHKDSWASSEYDSVDAAALGISYDDIPDYSWDENFTIEGFITRITHFNEKDRNGVVGNVEMLFYSSGIQYSDAKIPSEIYLVPDFRIQRITHAHSIHEILQHEHDIYLPVWLPKSFIEFAEDLIPDTVRTSGVPKYNTKAFQYALRENLPDSAAREEGLELVVWRITSITMWQQLNRTIDEVHEVLWSFYHANAWVTLEKYHRLDQLVGQLSRRAIRITAQDEYVEFTRWVARWPAHYNNYHDDLYRYLAQDPDEPISDSDEERVAVEAHYEGDAVEGG